MLILAKWYEGHLTQDSCQKLYMYYHTAAGPVSGSSHAITTEVKQGTIYERSLPMKVPT